MSNAPLEHPTSATTVVNQAASKPEACIRFLHAIGFSHMVPAAEQASVSLLAITQLSIQDLQERFSIERRSEAVALHDECGKLRHVLNRTSSAIDYPMWLPLVLAVTPAALAPPPYDPRRVQSARGHRYSSAGATPTASPSAPGSARKGPRRPLTASERMRFMMSGVPPPMPSQVERSAYRAKREYMQEQLAACQAQHRALLQQRGDPSVVPEPSASPRAAASQPRPPRAADEDARAADDAQYDVRAPDSPGKPPRRLPDHAAAAAAEAAKANVLRLVGEREAAVGAMRALLPTPRGVVARRHATRELLFEVHAIGELRADLAILLHEMRRTSAAVCRAIHEWKLTLRSRYAYFATLGEDSLGFYVGGVNYLRKMCSDLAFLPAPSAQDPLLLHWFGEQLPWVLEHSEELRDSCDGRLVASYDIKRNDIHSGVDSIQTRALAQLGAAQKDLLDQAAKHGTLCAPAALVKHAKPPDAPGADAPGAGQRWQYAAFQTLLYGGEVYVPLLRFLPRWFSHRAVTDAAVTVQQMYRNRLSRKFARTLRQQAERQRKLDHIARAKKHMRSAIFLQGMWRSFLMKRALKDASREAVREEKRRKSAAELELARQTAFRDQRRKEETAVIMLQRRWKVRLCKKSANNLRQQKAQRQSNASTLIAQTKSVALLEKVLSRHRASNSVMAGVYSQVCLGYEVTGLEIAEEAHRRTSWFRQLLELQTKVDTAQYRQETAVRALQAKSRGQAAAAGSALTKMRPQTAAGGRDASGAGKKMDVAAAAAFGTVQPGGTLAPGRPVSAPGGSGAPAGAGEKLKTMEEMQEEAMRCGPDGLPRIDLLAEVAEAKTKLVATSLLHVKLLAEVEAWEKTLAHTNNERPKSPGARRVPGQVRPDCR